MCFCDGVNLDWICDEKVEYVRIAVEEEEEEEEEKIVVEVTITPPPHHHKQQTYVYTQQNSGSSSSSRRVRQAKSEASGGWRMCVGWRRAWGRGGGRPLGWSRPDHAYTMSRAPLPPLLLSSVFMFEFHRPDADLRFVFLLCLPDLPPHPPLILSARPPTPPHALPPRFHPLGIGIEVRRLEGHGSLGQRAGRFLSVISTIDDANLATIRKNRRPGTTLP